MNIESALYQFLSTHSEVGAFFNDIEPAELPEKPDYPALVYQRAGTRPEHNIPFEHPRLQLDIYAKGAGAQAYGKAKEGADIVKSALKGFKGYFDTVPIKFVELVNERDMPTQEPLKRVRQDYRIHHKE